MQGLTDKIRVIIKKLNITAPPVPLKGVANLFLIRIVPYPDFPDNFSGVIVNRDGFVAIGVNKNHPEVRQRFTIAHELGHFLMGHSIDHGIIDKTFDELIDKEREANEFASELLMPIDFLKEDVKNKTSIPELAKRYLVSEQAMSIRLLKTSLINRL